MSDRTDFSLPGHNSYPLAERKCNLSLLTAYSRQWNPRNLEYHWYDPWAQILAALVAEHPSLSVAPQPYLWYDESHASQPYTTPRSDHHTSTEDEAVDDIGNATLDSIRSISVPSHRDRAKIPDFAVTRKISISRTDNTSHFLQLSRKVTYVGFPLLAELKASGPRSDDIGKSFFNARRPMLLAREQLKTQAFHLFNMYPHQQSVILVAITGFWWSYSIYSQGLMMEEKNFIVKDEDEEDIVDYDDEMADASFDDQDGIHLRLAQDPPILDPDEEAAWALQHQLRAYGFALSNLGEMTSEPGLQFHTILPASKLKLIDSGQWSDYLLYGTASSNQVFSLNLDRLREVVHYRGERG